ncbi:DoxX family protein [Rhodocytophaga rosea]|uniref:DoxX family protein n=1 Tax=Rhodocytophaga rosea TaxID=2704465 RepID=A0A6C0GNR3_9BACT|nr:DoxX family protein [Rhodocytophaga rosea]QHT69232.1 DoxX family protein [Rhodocytophaga rosea]
MSSLTHSPALGNYLKARVIAYWLVTAFIVFELIYGALWDFNVLNQGYVYEILRHLGYPLYLATILAVSKVAAAVVISIPGFRLLKEWAYAGVTVLFMGAFISHLAVGDGLDKSIWSLLFGVLTLISWALRPQNRRLI